MQGDQTFLEREPCDHPPFQGASRFDNRIDGRIERLRNSREDVVDFGLMHPGNGLLTKILGVLAVIFIVGMLVSFIFLT